MLWLYSPAGYPVVRFLSNTEVTVQREKWIAKSPSGTLFSRKQIPLKLAWAFSIHKSQVGFYFLVLQTINTVELMPIV